MPMCRLMQMGRTLVEFVEDYVAVYSERPRSSERHWSVTSDVMCNPETLLSIDQREARATRFRIAEFASNVP